MPTHVSTHTATSLYTIINSITLISAAKNYNNKKNNRTNKKTEIIKSIKLKSVEKQLYEKFRRNRKWIEKKKSQNLEKVVFFLDESIFSSPCSWLIIGQTVFFSLVCQPLVLENGNSGFKLPVLSQKIDLMSQLIYCGEVE